MSALSKEMEPPPGVEIPNLLRAFRVNGKLKSVKSQVPLQRARVARISTGALVVVAIQDTPARLGQLDIVCAYITALIKRDICVWIGEVRLRSGFAKFDSITSARIMMEAASSNPKGFGFKCTFILEEATKTVVKMSTKMFVDK